MAGMRVDFSTIAWDGWANELPARFKVARDGGQQVRLIELGPGWVEPEWCEKGHAGYVVSGTYVQDVEDGTWVMRQGQGFILPPGTRHRSRNTGSLPCVIFLADLGSAPAAAGTHAATATATVG